MASKSGSSRATLAVGPGFCSRKGAIAFTPPTSRSDNKSDELEAPEKGTPAPSHISTPAPSHASALALAESTLALKYSETDLMRILKIFSKTKGQEPKAEAPCKQPLKTKVPDIYFRKLYINCYYFFQQCEEHFETTGTIKLNRTLFAATFLYGKINFWLHQY